MGYRVGERAGQYEVLRLLGRGTFGEVLLARDSDRPQHLAALKTIACDQLAGDAAERSRRAALAEARLLLRLRHPHIVRCEEVQWDADRRVVWFALEYMDGGDAQGFVDDRREAGGQPSEAHFVRRVLAAVGSALRYVHDLGVLHRDVKPANVLLARRSQRIKLGDFGIAKLLETTGRAYTVVGTPYYLSPEIVSGQAYGPPSDAWALGVLLYELVTLRRPFEAANPLALVRRICEGPWDSLPPDTAPDICRAIDGLLERDARKRLTLAEVLAVGGAVAALATEDMACSLEAAPMVPDSWELSSADAAELSPVSIATSDSGGGGGSPSSREGGGAAEIVATLCGVGQAAAPALLAADAAQVAAPSSAGARPAVAQAEGAERPPESPDDGVHAAVLAAPRVRQLLWQDSEAMAQARAALTGEVDDPEELQIALFNLEQSEVPRSCGGASAEAYEALRCELQLRIAALRADAAALLKSLIIDVPRPLLASFSAGGCPASVVYDTDAEPPGADTVTTMFMHEDSSAADNSLPAGDDVAALENAIELATSLGVDTESAEEQAASARGRLSLRVAWGASAVFCLLPLGVPFAALMAEVARRFGLSRPHGVVAGAGTGVGTAGASSAAAPTPFPFEFRDDGPAGPQAFQAPLRDEASWEAFLKRRGLQGRPGRAELRVHAPQTPFIVMGTRLSSAGGAPTTAVAPSPAGVPGGPASRLTTPVRPCVMVGRPGRAAIPRAPPLGGMRFGSAGSARPPPTCSGGAEVKPPFLPPRSHAGNHGAAAVCGRRPPRVVRGEANEPAALHIEGTRSVPRAAGLRP